LDAILWMVSGIRHLEDSLLGTPEALCLPVRRDREVLIGYVV